MSDTPRTDKFETARINNLVPADFARQLERENNTFRNAQKICEDCDAPTKEEFLKWKALAQELAKVVIHVGSTSAEDMSVIAAANSAIARFNTMKENK